LFKLLVASVSTDSPKDGKQISDRNEKVVVQYGDFRGPLKKSAEALLEASKYGANETQKKMLQGYASRYSLQFIE
jgi:dipeptidyl-peptidase-3